MQLLELWRTDAFQVLTTSSLQDELIKVLPRPKFTSPPYNLTQQAIDAVLEEVATMAIMVQPAVKVPVVVRDVEDERVLAAAIGGQADYLITGDEDLLELAGNPAIHPLQIVTVREFLDNLASSTISDDEAA